MVFDGANLHLHRVHFVLPVVMRSLAVELLVYGVWLTIVVGDAN